MTDETQKEENSEKESHKYAGKFSTVEELEQGYKNSAKVYQENENLKKQIEEIKSVPTDYLKPDSINLKEDELTALKSWAKNAKLSQKQFDQLALDRQAAIHRSAQSKEDAFKSLGEDKINLLKDYTNKYYPPKVAEKVFDNLVLDPEVRKAALEHREQLLNSSVPGVNKNSFGGYSVTYDDVLKARESHLKAKNNPKLRDNYLRMTAEYAKQKEK